MITLKKVQVYSKYKGDVDLWSRNMSSDEKSIMEESDWSKIESIVDELNVLKKKNEKTNINSTQRTYKVMTEEEVENAYKEIMRFTMVAPDEYEAVIEELWKYA